jgi:hypothetical protein
VSADSSPADKLPSPEEFLLEVPLYKEYHFNGASHSHIQELAAFKSSVDVYCVECERHSIFWGQGNDKEISPGGVYWPTGDTAAYLKHILRDRDFYVELRCSRVQEHKMLFYFTTRNQKLIKVGQHPSLADLHLKGLHKYRQPLGKEVYKEFARGVGLFAHGVGIGSFVYLRRIFEGLITDAYKGASQEATWDDGIYQRARMDEKIIMLKDHLPQVLVNNAGMYSILSKGIHSLSEDECLKYFNTIKLGIELILDEKIEREEREKKIKGVTDEISRIKGNLS